MSLKPVLDNLDNVDDGLKALYVEQDGKYRLDVEGGFKTHDEINGLTSALNKERDARSKLEREVKKFEGLDPEKAFEALNTISNLDQKKLIDAGEVDKVKQEVQKAMQTKVDELQKTIAEKENLIKEKDQTLERELIGGRFTGSKYIKDKLDIPHDLVYARFGKNFKVEEGKVIGYDNNGNQIYSKEKPGELADTDEALSILVEQYPYKDSILKGSRATGPGIVPGGVSGNIDWQKLSPTERLNAARRAGK